MSFCSRAEGARLEKGWRMGCRSSAFAHSHVRCRGQSCSRSTLECQALRVRYHDEQFALSWSTLRFSAFIKSTTLAPAERLSSSAATTFLPFIFC